MSVFRIHQIFPQNDTSVRRIFQTIQTAKKCTFTGTGRSDHTDNLALLMSVLTPFSCMYAAAESLGQVLNLDQGLFFSTLTVTQPPLSKMDTSFSKKSTMIR